MTLPPDVTPDTAPGTPIGLPPRWLLLCMAVGSFIAYRLLAQPGNPQLAIPIMAVITAHCYAIALRWDVRQRASVWAVVVASLALHAALILSVPWTTTRIPARAIVPFVIVDVFVIISMIRVVAPTRETQDVAE
jgi:uncharacterized membrane protein YhhN